MEDTQTRLLRTAFLAGAVTDALALVPLLLPAAARLLWGFEANDPAFRFASGYAAALMLGWTCLLLWAARRPIERRFVAPLTVIVIYGLAASEIAAIASGAFSVARMLPTLLLQAGLLTLFASAYHYPSLRRRQA